MKLKTKLILIILLIFVMTPEFLHYDTEYEKGWKFVNLYYRETNPHFNDECLLPFTSPPTHHYAYHSFFLRMQYTKALCGKLVWDTTYEIDISVATRMFNNDSFIWINLSERAFRFYIFGNKIVDPLVEK